MYDFSEIENMAYENLYKNQGARIMFKCDQVTYQGIIDSILPDNRQVGLRHAKVMEGDVYFGNLRFKFRDIYPFTVVESAEQVNRVPRNDYLLKILRNNLPVPSADVSKALFGDNESDDEDIDEEKKEEQFFLDLPEHLESKLPNDYCVIDFFNKDFDLAIKHIAAQQVIGVSFEGHQISRFGKLTWICISTEVCSFVFDVQKLGKQSFDDGLRQIFENKSIKKVIHDCRFPSDCLAHQYTTILANVFDTRVADFIINMQKCTDNIKFTSFRSLDSCLRFYLNVPQEFLFKREVDSNEGAFSSKRPITNGTLYDLLKNVLYLNLLHEVMYKELLFPVYRASQFYCNVLSKSSKEVYDTIGSELSKPDSIPPCILMNGIQTVRFEKPKKPRRVSLGCVFGESKTDKVLDSKTALHTPPIAVKDSSNLKDIKQSVTKELPKKNESKPYGARQKKSNVVSNVSVNDCAKDVKSLSVKPSFRHMDEVYHKLINGKYPDQFDSVIDVKPSNRYISKFSVRQPFSSCSSASSDSSESIKDSDIDVPFEHRSLPSNKNNGRCQVSWSELLAEENRHSSDQNRNGYNIRFVPG